MYMYFSLLQYTVTREEPGLNVDTFGTVLVQCLIITLSFIQGNRNSVLVIDVS